MLEFELENFRATVNFIYYFSNVLHKEFPKRRQTDIPSSQPWETRALQGVELSHSEKTACNMVLAVPCFPFVLLISQH